MKPGSLALVLVASLLLAVAPDAGAAEGDSLWTRTYGGTDTDAAYSAIRVNDGGYLTAGSSFSSPTYYEDAYLVKTDSTGAPLWTRYIGGQEHWRATSCVQAPDSSFFVAGYVLPSGSSYDMLLLKTNSHGDSLWSWHIGGAENESVRDMVLTPDGGCLLVGELESWGAGLGDFWVVRTSSTGGILWERTYGSTGTEWPSAVTRTSDGGYLVAGQSNSFSSSLAWWVLRIDAVGDTLWTRTYQGDYTAYLTQAIETSDHGFLLAGTDYPTGGAGRTDWWLVKTDSLGNVVWDRNYGGNDDDEPYALMELPGGGYLAAGRTRSASAGGWDMWVMRLRADLTRVWDHKFGGTAADEAYALLLDQDGNYRVIGNTWSYGAGRYDVWVVCLEGEVPTGVEPPATSPAARPALAVSPNPFRSAVTVRYEIRAPGPVTLRIYDVAGRLVTTLVNSWQGAGTHEATFDGSAQASRIYLARLEAGGDTATRKLILLK